MISRPTYFASRTALDRALCWTDMHYLPLTRKSPVLLVRTVDSVTGDDVEIFWLYLCFGCLMKRTFTSERVRMCRTALFACPWGNKGSGVATANSRCSYLGKPFRIGAPRARSLDSPGVWRFMVSPLRLVSARRPCHQPTPASPQHGRRTNCGQLPILPLRIPLSPGGAPLAYSLPLLR